MNDSTKMIDERKAYLEKAPLDWEVGFWEEQVGIAAAELNKIESEEDQYSDADFAYARSDARLQLERDSHNLTKARISSIIKAGRSARTRQLGKMYGEASQTIHDQRAEIALLRSQLREEVSKRYYVAEPVEYGLVYEYPYDANRTQSVVGPMPFASAEEIVERTHSRSAGIKAKRVERSVMRGQWFLPGSDEPIEEKS